MKIGILTLHSQINYGGLLQAYALQTLLAKKGFNVEFVDYWFSRNNVALTGGIIDQDFGSIKRIVRFFKNLIQNGYVYSEIVRRKRTQSFLRHYLHCSQQTYKTYLELSKLTGYDAVIVGSDQVWNYQWFGVPNPFLLGAVKEDQKRVSYAASFGFKNLPDDRVTEYRQALNKFSFLSVREQEGQHIIARLIHKQSEWVLDPTLLLSAAEWNELCDREEAEKDAYIVCYWLGDLRLIIKLLMSLLKHKNMRAELFIDTAVLNKSFGSVRSVVAHLFLKFHTRISCRFDAGPLEFVNAVSCCKGVVSDSFHMLMFACIFRKPFKIIVNSSKSRQGMSARLLNFVNKYDLNSGVALDPPRESLELFKPDYDAVWDKLAIDVRSSVAYLLKSIEN